MDDFEVFCPQCGYRPPKPVELIDGVIPLDDELWSQLETAYGDGIVIAHWLRDLGSLREPIATAWLGMDIWGALVHQNSVYSASFAAVPHLVKIAGRLLPESYARQEILVLVGAISGDGRLSAVSSAVGRAGYLLACVTALRDAAQLIAESLLTKPDEDTSKWLLAALAAMAGHERLWHNIQYVFDSVECPGCGKMVMRE